MSWSKKNYGLLASILAGGILVIMVFAATWVSSVVAETDANPRLRIAHLAPFASGSGSQTAVTVTLSNNINQVVYGPKSMKYLDSEPYVSLSQGSYILRVFPNDGSSAIIQEVIQLDDDTDYTAVIAGEDSNQDYALIFESDDNSVPSGKAKLRFGHVAPFADTTAGTLVDIRYQDGTAVTTNMPYGQIVDSYLELNPGSYDFKITKVGGEVTLIDPLPISLSSGDVQNVYAIGDGNNQSLGAYGWPSGSTGASLPLSTKANLQIVHLGPLDDPTLSSTEITITFDSEAVVDNFKYGDSTPYEPIEAKAYSVQVYIEDNPWSISETHTFNAGMDYTLFFRGGNSEHVVGLDQVTNNNAAPPEEFAKLRFGNLSAWLLDSRVDIRLQDGTLVVGGLLYREFTEYLVTAETFIDLKITTVGGGTTLADPRAVILGAGEIGMLVVAGDDRTQPVAAFYIPDGKRGNFVPEEDPGPAGLKIKKTPDVQDVEFGGKVEFNISVTNTGAVSLTNVTVTDTLAPACNSILGTLSPDETKEITCSKTNVNESFLNTAEVAGNRADQPDVEVSDQDTAAVIVIPEGPGPAGITIHKTPEVQNVKDGGTAEFTISVTNTGAVALTDVTVTDDQAPACNKLLGTLAPNETKEVTCSKENVTISFFNTASVVGTSADKPDVAVSDQDRAAVIVITKFIYLPIVTSN